MPNLNRSKDGGVERWLKKLNTRQVEHNVRRVEMLLASRSVFVRMEAAQALGRAGVGAHAIRERIIVEKNELVLTDLTEALLSTGEVENLDLLEDLAKSHRSNLVRSYALIAIADLSRESSLSFLRLRLKAENSHRVKATLLVLLFVYGADDALGGLFGALHSRDATIRRQIANLLSYYRPRRKRQEILARLAAAFQVETNPGIRDGLEKAIRILKGRGKRSRS